MKAVRAGRDPFAEGEGLPDLPVEVGAQSDARSGGPLVAAYRRHPAGRRCGALPQRGRMIAKLRPARPAGLALPDASAASLLAYWPSPLSSRWWLLWWARQPSGSGPSPWRLRSQGKRCAGSCSVAWPEPIAIPSGCVPRSRAPGGDRPHGGRRRVRASL